MANMRTLVGMCLFGMALASSPAIAVQRTCSDLLAPDLPGEVKQVSENVTSESVSIAISILDLGIRHLDRDIDDFFANLDQLIAKRLPSNPFLNFKSSLGRALSIQFDQILDQLSSSDWEILLGLLSSRMHDGQEQIEQRSVDEKRTQAVVQMEMKWSEQIGFPSGRFHSERSSYVPGGMVQLGNFGQQDILFALLQQAPPSYPTFLRDRILMVFHSNLATGESKLVWTEKGVRVGGPLTVPSSLSGKISFTFISEMDDGQTAARRQTLTEAIYGLIGAPKWMVQPSRSDPPLVSKRLAGRGICESHLMDGHARSAKCAVKIQGLKDAYWFEDNERLHVLLPNGSGLDSFDEIEIPIRHNRPLDFKSVAFVASERKLIIEGEALVRPQIFWTYDLQTRELLEHPDLQLMFPGESEVDRYHLANLEYLGGPTGAAKFVAFDRQFGKPTIAYFWTANFATGRVVMNAPIELPGTEKLVRFLYLVVRDEEQRVLGFLVFGGFDSLTYTGDLQYYALNTTAIQR